MSKKDKNIVIPSISKLSWLQQGHVPLDTCKDISKAAENVPLDPTAEYMPVEEWGTLRGVCQSGSLPSPRGAKMSPKTTSNVDEGGPEEGDPRVLYNYNNLTKKKVGKKQKAWDELVVEKTYDPSRIEEVELTSAMTPSDNEEFDDVKEAIQILRSTERTIVFAIVIDKKNEENNVMSAIRCNGGTAFGGYARDAARDSYIVQCVEFLQLGSVAFSYVMTMPSAGNWQVKVPIPETVLEKYFNPQQKKTLADYRERYPKSNYDIHFIQLMGCH